MGPAALFYQTKSAPKESPVVRFSRCAIRELWFMGFMCTFLESVYFLLPADNNALMLG